MTDVTTKQPLRVLCDGMTVPYINVPESQLEELQRLLDDHDIRYWVDEQVISFEDRPFMAVVNLDRKADPKAVQAVLDSAP